MKLQATLEHDEVKKLLTSYVEKKTGRKVKDLSFDDNLNVNIELELTASQPDGDE